MPVTVPSPRTRLRWFLENQLLSIEKGKSSPQSMVLQPLLRQAVEGLVALDYGEVQAIFVPGKKGKTRDGTKPYTLRKLRMMALGFIDLLQAKGHLEKTARRLVADGHGESYAVVKKWKTRPTLGKTRDPMMIAFKQKVTESNWDEEHVKNELKNAGINYKLQKKLAFKSKKVKGK